MVAAKFIQNGEIADDHTEVGWRDSAALSGAIA